MGWAGGWGWGWEEGVWETGEYATPSSSVVLLCSIMIDRIHANLPLWVSRPRACYQRLPNQYIFKIIDSPPRSTHPLLM